MISDLNSRFKELRKIMELSQVELATDLGVKQGTISDIERNRIGVSKKIINRLTGLYRVNEVWFLTGEGEPFIGINDILKGKNTGTGQGLHTFTENYKSRNIQPYDFYKHLSIKDLDFELSLEIEDSRDAFEDYRKLVEFVHNTYPGTYLSEKFSLGPTFKEYKEGMESEFSEEHKHLRDEFTIKVLKIVDLYQSMSEHWKRQLSTLIDYLHKTTSFHPKKPKLK